MQIIWKNKATAFYGIIFFIILYNPTSIKYFEKNTENNDADSVITLLRRAICTYT